MYWHWLQDVRDLDALEQGSKLVGERFGKIDLFLSIMLVHALSLWSAQRNYAFKI